MSLRFAQDEEEEEERAGAGLSRALYVEDQDLEDMDESHPPQDGFEFLRRVMKERSRCEDVVTVELDPKMKEKIKESQNGMFVNRNKVRAPDGCAPSESWQREQVAEFSQVRISFSRQLRGQAKKRKLPSINDEDGWRRFCYGRPASEAGGEAAQRSEGHEPLVSLVSSLSSEDAGILIEFHVSWMHETGWEERYGAWLYGLLLRVEKPLSPQVASILRDLAVTSSVLRGQIAPESSSGAQDAGGEPDPAVAALNLLICLVAKYFEQGDLVD